MTAALLQPEKKLKCQFHSENCMALTTGLFVFFGKISAQEQDVVQYSITSTKSHISVWNKICHLAKRRTRAQCLLVESSAESYRHSVCTLCFHLLRIEISFLTIDAISRLESGVVCLPAIVY